MLLGKIRINQDANTRSGVLSPGTWFRISDGSHSFFHDIVSRYRSTGIRELQDSCRRTFGIFPAKGSRAVRKSSISVRLVMR